MSRLTCADWAGLSLAGDITAAALVAGTVAGAAWWLDRRAAARMAHMQAELHAVHLLLQRDSLSGLSRLAEDLAQGMDGLDQINRAFNGAAARLLQLGGRGAPPVGSTDDR